MSSHDEEPRYVISIAAKIIGVQTHTLRYYEKVGLVEPSRSQGNIRLYSEKDIRQLHQIRSLIDELGVNLAGVDIILHMLGRISQLQSRLEELESQLRQLEK